eukprot:jgi/Chrpa1/24934/Chrysochromulina_OHIO_Genome00013321-RA
MLLAQQPQLGERLVCCDEIGLERDRSPKVLIRLPIVAQLDEHLAELAMELGVRRQQREGSPVNPGRAALWQHPREGQVHRRPRRVEPKRAHGRVARSVAIQVGEERESIRVGAIRFGTAHKVILGNVQLLVRVVLDLEALRLLEPPARILVVREALLLLLLRRTLVMALCVDRQCGAPQRVRELVVLHCTLWRERDRLARVAERATRIAGHVEHATDAGVGLDTARLERDGPQQVLELRLLLRREPRPGLIRQLGSHLALDAAVVVGASDTDAGMNSFVLCIDGLQIYES